LSGRGLCDELITRPEESYRLCCVVVCDLETSRMGAPYIYGISHLRVKLLGMNFLRSPIPFFLCTNIFPSTLIWNIMSLCTNSVSTNKCMEWTIWPSLWETGSTPTRNKRQNCSCMLFFTIVRLKTGRQKFLVWVSAVDLPESNYCASQGMSVVDCP